MWNTTNWPSAAQKIHARRARSPQQIISSSTMT
jgi:hypothetical protein